MKDIGLKKDNDYLKQRIRLMESVLREILLEKSMLNFLTEETIKKINALLK